MPPQTARRLLPVRHRPEPNAAHKTVARRALSRASQMAGAAGCDDALLVDQDGYVLETSVANVFVRINDRLVTPPLDGRILPGIWRQVLIEEGVLERRVRLEEARDAALLLTSAGADRLPATCEIDTGNIPS